MLLKHCCGIKLDIVLELAEGALCPFCGYDISIENCYKEEEE
jgi:hypothetical protein